MKNQINNFSVTYPYSSIVITFTYGTISSIWTICTVAQYLEEVKASNYILPASIYTIRGLASYDDYILTSSDDPFIYYIISDKAISKIDTFELKLKLEKTVNLYYKLLKMKAKIPSKEPYINNLIYRIFFNLSGLSKSEINYLNRCITNK